MIHPDDADRLTERIAAAGLKPVAESVERCGTYLYGRRVYEVPVEIIGDVRTVDLGPVRDLAFMPREPNPTTKIRTQDGEAIYIESPHFGLPSFLKGHPVYGNNLVSRLALARLARERDAEEGRSPWGSLLS